MRDYAEVVEQAAAAVAAARAMLVGAGAGMGVDSGLPDFRGTQGFWRAYPPYAELGLGFSNMANPVWFTRDPSRAWGFYGHRLELYRRTEPHRGFAILQRWAEAMSAGLFAFTSNVDGQFQKAGIDPARVAECHGSIHHLQCAGPCQDSIWDATEVSVAVNESSFRAAGPLPSCSRCGGMARPNVLMFGDGGWIGSRTGEQQRRLQQWLGDLGDCDLVVVECGAGTAIPTVRMECEHIAQRFGAKLIRINPREAQGPRGTLSISRGALWALEAIDAALKAG